MWCPKDEDYTKHIGKMVRINYEGDYNYYPPNTRLDKYDLRNRNGFPIIPYESHGVIEGKLIHIEEFLVRELYEKEMKKKYAIKIIDNKNREIKIQYPLRYFHAKDVNVIIKKISIREVDEKLEEINNVVNKICEKYLVDDLSNVINQYVDIYKKI